MFLKSKSIKFILIYLFLLPCLSVQAALDNRGKEFIIMFPGNHNDSSDKLSLFISSIVPTTGTVSISGINFNKSFTTTAGNVTIIDLPNNAQVITSDSIENKGIFITAAEEVSVYGLNLQRASTDAFLGLPLDVLGTEYINLGYRNVNVVNGSQLAIVGTVDNTTVTIKPTATVGTHNVNIPYDITLNKGQTYLLRTTLADGDLSGTIITATQKIAVFGGHKCSNVPSGSVTFCDYLVEQLPPTNSWGRSFVTLPLATRNNGDTFQILVAIDNTEIKINGIVVATLNRGQFHNQIIDGGATITANNPILVAQYSNSTSFDGITSDPFMMLIPPFEQFQTSYTIISLVEAQFIGQFLNVVVANVGVGNILLDNTAIPANSFTAIGTSGFSGAQIPVSQGIHNLSSNIPFGTFVYGFGSAESYGYPAGSSLSAVALVDSLALTPDSNTGPFQVINNEFCTLSTVTDSNGTPLVGIRVDFSVTGVNPQVVSIITDIKGQAKLCYTGTVSGIDTISSVSGTLTKTNTVEWFKGVNLDLTPPTASLLLNTEHCVTSILTDDANNAIANATLTLTITGVHPQTKAVTTDATGKNVFCYTGTKSGLDTISSVSLLGSLTKTATAQWNTAPVVNVPTGNQTAIVGQAFNLTVTSTDPETGQTVVISATNLPNNATFTPGAAGNPTSGVLTFNPSADQAGQTFTINCVATDSLGATTNFSVTIVVPNTPPTVTNMPVGIQTVNIGQPFNLTVTATDPTAGQTVVISALNLPANAIFTPGAAGNTTTGTLVFTPAANQAGQTFTINCVVTDSFSPPAITNFDVVIKVPVTPVNIPPSVTAPTTIQTATIGQATTVNISATDADNAQTVLLSITNLPANAIFTPAAAGNPTTGVLVFTPSATQGGQTFIFNGIATDSGNPTSTTNFSVVISVESANNSFADTDNDGISDILEGLLDNDNDGILNFADYDPTGYFYDEVTGRIIAGGNITVTCDTGTPQFVNNFDGTNGFYQFIVTGVGAPSICTITPTIPVGYNASTACLNGGELDVNPGPAAQTLGSSEIGNTQILASSSCANNPFFLRLRINANDAFVFNNNIPLSRIAGAPSAAPVPVLSLWMLLLLSSMLLLMSLFTQNIFIYHKK